MSERAQSGGHAWRVGEPTRKLVADLEKMERIRLKYEVREEIGSSLSMAL